MDINKRIYFLKKIAQEAATQTTTTQTTTPPTETVETIVPVSSPPTSFNASTTYPNIDKAFGTNNKIFIDTVCNMLNNALHYTSNGKINLNILRQNTFNYTGPKTGFDPVLISQLIDISKLVYLNLLTNNGQVFEPSENLNIAEKNQKINNIINSQSLTNMKTSLNVVNVPADFKTKLLNELRKIK